MSVEQREQENGGVEIENQLTVARGGIDDAGARPNRRVQLQHLSEYGRSHTEM